MMLIGNYTVRNKSPGRFFAGGSAASTNEGQARSNFNGTARRSIHYMDGASAAVKKWGQPTGGYADVSWMFPYTQGNIVSHSEAQGAALTTASIIDGRPIAGAADGASTAEATGQLVVSGTGTADGVATVTGNINAAILATGTADGIATVTGSIGALAFAVGATNGTSTAAMTPYATGQLVGSIVPAVELEASTFSSYLMDQEDVETGLTMRQALRLIASATAGKISGASGTTVTIRNAVADGKDRIVATVDGDGNRTAITYDLGD